jgi:hypothetical protein
MLLVFGRSENGEIGLGVAASGSRPGSLLQTTGHVKSKLAAADVRMVGQPKHEAVNMFDPQRRKMRANYVISSPFDEEDDADDLVRPSSRSSTILVTAASSSSIGGEITPIVRRTDLIGSNEIEAPTRTRVVRAFVFLAVIPLFPCHHFCPPVSVSWRLPPYSV